MNERIRTTYPTLKKIRFSLCYIWLIPGPQIPQNYEACVELMTSLVEQAQQAGEGVAA